MNFSKFIFSVFNSVYYDSKTPALAGYIYSLQPVHLFFHLPSACPERSRRVFSLSCLFWACRRAFSLEFPLAFCFELQYSYRPTHPKTKIVIGLAPGIAPEPWLLHPIVGKKSHLDLHWLAKVLAADPIPTGTGPWAHSNGRMERSCLSYLVKNFVDTLQPLE